MQPQVVWQIPDFHEYIFINETTTNEQTRLALIDLKIYNSGISTGIY